MKVNSGIILTLMQKSNDGTDANIRSWIEYPSATSTVVTVAGVALIMNCPLSLLLCHSGMMPLIIHLFMIAMWHVSF